MLPLKEQETALANEKQVVEAEAQSRLRQSGYRQLQHIACEFHEGILTLRGQVTTFHLKQIAQTLIRGLDGVGKINNRLEVAVPFPARVKREASTTATSRQGRPPGDRAMNRFDKCSPVPSWHEQFLSMLPAIKSHATMAFRHLNSQAREEAIQEAIASALVVFVRLVQLKKVDLAYPTVLAHYAVAQVKRQTVLAMRKHSFVC